MVEITDKKLSIIIVNHKSEKKIERCLSSIFSLLKEINYEVIVINNDDKSFLEAMRIKFPQIKIIEKNENIGFGKGVNLGAAVAQGEFLLILNPDAELLSGDIQMILEEFYKNERTGIIGSKIVDFRGKIQPWIAGTKKNLWDLAKNNLGIYASKKIWESPIKVEADWVAGTAMFIRRKVFFALSGFDEKFFLYFEDADLCLRAKSLGMDIFYFPSFTARHLGGVSFSGQKEQKKCYYDSQEYYFKKHRPRWEYSLVKLLRIFYS